MAMGATEIPLKERKKAFLEEYKAICQKYQVKIIPIGKYLVLDNLGRGDEQKVYFEHLQKEAER